MTPKIYPSISALIFCEIHAFPHTELFDFYLNRLNYLAHLPVWNRETDLTFEQYMNYAWTVIQQINEVSPKTVEEAERVISDIEFNGMEVLADSSTTLDPRIAKHTQWSMN